jgi:hypothetical protein
MGGIQACATTGEKCAFNTTADLSARQSITIGGGRQVFILGHGFAVDGSCKCMGWKLYSWSYHILLFQRVHGYLSSSDQAPNLISTSPSYRTVA